MVLVGVVQIVQEFGTLEPLLKREVADSLVFVKVLDVVLFY